MNRNFHADEPNRLWLTDITEFRLPGGEKIYLVYYRDGRIKKSLGWLSPMEYRRKLVDTPRRGPRNRPHPHLTLFHRNLEGVGV